MATKSLAEKTKKTRFTMSYDDYLQWAPENSLTEWVGGEVIIHVPPKHEHQSILGFLYALIGEYVGLFKLGIVQIAPYEVKLWSDGPGREPDMFFFKEENKARLRSKRLEGPPDLAVEIISPDSVYRDRDDKFHEYAEAGVVEYWIIDSRPGRRRADFYQLTDAGHYQFITMEDSDRVESNVLPGFWLSPAWLWQGPQPTVIGLLFNMSAETAVAIQKQISPPSETE